MATEATFVLNSPTQTDRLTRDSRQTQTPQEPVTGAVITSFKILTTRVTDFRIISIFAAWNERHTFPVRSDG
jgi:hypothetical protein